MAVVSSREAPNGRRGTIKQDLSREYTRTWIVITDSAYDDALTVMFAPGLPALDDPYEIAETGVNDPQATVVSYNPTQPDPQMPTLWMVEVNYSTSTAKDPALVSTAGSAGTTPGGGGQSEPPDQMPPQIKISTQYRQELFTQERLSDNTGDSFGDPVQNTARQEFKIVPSVDEAYQVVSIRKASLFFDRLAARDYVNRVNSIPFRGYPARSCWLARFDAERAYLKRVPFWWIDYEIHIGYPRQWDQRLRNTGTQYWNGGVAGGDLTVARDTAGNVVEIDLAEDGDFLLGTDDPVYLDFNAKWEFDFNELNLPFF